MDERAHHGKGNAVVRNVVWLGLGEVISRALIIVLLIAVARVLGVHDYGLFAVGLSVASLAHIFAQFGVPALFIRESAQDARWERAFPAFLALILFSGLGAFLVLGGGAFLLTVDTSLRLLFLFFGGYVAAMTVLELFYAFFRAREEMRYEAVLKVVQAAAIGVLAVIVLVRAPTAHYLALGYAGGAFMVLLLMMGIFWRRVRSLRIAIDISLFKTVFSRAWPLGAAGIFAAVFSHTDSVMLGAFGQITEAGWYSAAYRVVGVCLIPTVVLGHSFLPALSRRMESAVSSLQHLWERQVEAALMLGVPASIGGFFLAPGIIALLYTSEFEPSIFVLQLLMWTVALAFFVSAAGYLLFAAGAQKQSFWIMGAGALGNVLLNLWLIPAYSFYGAAAATVATYALLFFLYAAALQKYTPARLYTFSLGKVLLIVAGASALMTGALLAASPASLWFLLVLGVGTYSVSYLILRRAIL
ncbi:oligosaccharide flippase family protein [Patescibacteria group bacterium]|nr:oligosaccharide flippase family protein [Patescibacteria group bacterium]